MDPSCCSYYGTGFIVSDSSSDGPEIRFVREPNSKDLKSVGYPPKKPRILTKEEFERFLQEARDNRFLIEKVILIIIVVCGALRKDALLKITIDDIEDKESIIILRIPYSKTHTPRCFVCLSSTKCSKCAKRNSNCPNLPHPETYTGHYFRHSSTTLLAHAGADISTIKRHGVTF
ncbi:hypothetical protein NQ317_002908 [Molorchus minor]|uniref:Tyr recombinase domain-containing protein n=1 Tax=Molorchus minor TaxID=1323400 RepID=A0ABQ9JK04_9CUCU|nr:hypothetical protein NQ317_002908 [Molorchus minor]